MRGVTKWTNEKKGLKIHRAENAQVNIVETWPGSLKKKHKKDAQRGNYQNKKGSVNSGRQRNKQIDETGGDSRKM